MPSPVLVNVYDLGEFNGYIGWLGVGVFHSGVQVYGKEYAFGAHMYECSGIFSTEPLEAPGEVVFKGQIDMGETRLSEEEVDELITDMGERYMGSLYHLLQTNCNHFCSDLCFALVGKRPPAWINRLADVTVSVHCLFPPTWLPPLKPPTVEPAAEGAGEATGGNRVLSSAEASSSRAAAYAVDASAAERAPLAQGLVNPPRAPVNGAAEQPVLEAVAPSDVEVGVGGGNG